MASTKSKTASKSKTESKQRAADSARARLAAEQQRERRRKRRRLLVLVPVGVVVLAVLILVGVKVLDRPAQQAGPVSPAVPSKVTSVPITVLNQVGSGTNRVAPSVMNSSPLTEGGKPKVLYIGAEFCPYCAADRWPLAVALSRFGTLSGLGQITSSEGKIPTLSFQGASLKSSTIAFAGYEIEDQSHKPLQTPPAADQQIFQTYGGGSFPFVDIGGRYLINSTSYDESVLSGKTHEQIATALSDPNSDIAKAVDGTANVITAAICKTTDGAPATVCTSAGVQAAASKLG